MQKVELAFANNLELVSTQSRSQEILKYLMLEFTNPGYSSQGESINVEMQTLTWLSLLECPTIDERNEEDISSTSLDNLVIEERTIHIETPHPCNYILLL